MRHKSQELPSYPRMELWEMSQNYQLHSCFEYQNQSPLWRVQVIEQELIVYGVSDD